MERRFVLALGLCVLVLWVWSALTSKFYPIDKQRVTELPPPPLSLQRIPENELSTFSISSPQQALQVVFSEAEASIREVIFKTYGDYHFSLPTGFFQLDKALVFQKEIVSAQQVSFRSQDNQKQVIKRFLFSSESDYRLGLEIEVKNLSPAPLPVDLGLLLGDLDFSRNTPQARFLGVSVGLEDKVLFLNPRRNREFKAVKFLALKEQYFCAIIEPKGDNYTGFIQKINPAIFRVGLSSKEILLPAQASLKYIFSIYLGPQELRLIHSLNPVWSRIIYYGTFDIITHFLLQLLEVIHNLVHNWGLAIILLSFIIYLLLYPLTLKQMRSIKQMQLLQPYIEELRNLYKDNPQRLNKEIMELYRKHKVNPFGGCLPLLLQIPVFIALYQGLVRFVALKGAKFLWIKDLSASDRLFILPFNLPILGNEINILPILMVGIMFMQQRISSPQTQGATAQSQRLMVILFPILLGVIFYHLPAGLVLYWLVNSLFMLLSQWRISQLR